jgi:hypothetical protein
MMAIISGLRSDAPELLAPLSSRASWVVGNSMAM